LNLKQHSGFPLAHLTNSLQYLQYTEKEREKKMVNKNRNEGIFKPELILPLSPSHSHRYLTRQTNHPLMYQRSRNHQVLHRNPHEQLSKCGGYNDEDDAHWTKKRRSLMKTRMSKKQQGQMGHTRASFPLLMELISIEILLRRFDEECRKGRFSSLEKNSRNFHTEKLLVSVVLTMCCSDCCSVGN
jgi:hypothetical protein